MKKIPRSYLYLVIVCAAALLVWVLERPTIDKKGDLLNRPLIENLNRASIAEIEIEYLLEGIRLKKEGEEWKVASLEESGQSEEQKEKPLTWYRADPKQIDLKLDILEDTELTSLVSRNPEKHGRYEVAAAGMEIRFLDPYGNKLEHLFLGKSSDGSVNESYVRKEGAQEVYAVDRTLRNHFSMQSSAWRNRTLWEIPPERMNKVTIERKKNPFSLEKTNDQWKYILPEEKEADSEKVKNLLGSLSNIRAINFEGGERKKEMGLENPRLSITIGTDEGSTYQLKIGSEREPSQYYAVQEDIPEIYVIGDTLLKAIPEDWNAFPDDAKEKK